MSDARPICRLRIWTDDEKEEEEGRGRLIFRWVAGGERALRPSVGGQIDLGFPVCPYFQKEATVRGTEWRRGGPGGRGAEERGEEGSGAGVGPLMDLKCCHCADEMRMAKAERTMEREGGRG